VLAVPRAKDESAGQRRPAANRVNGGRPGKIGKAERFRQKATTPVPGSLDRVDERCEQENKDQEREELDALCNRARNDRGGGGAEHHLKEKVRRGRSVREVRFVRRQPDWL